MTGYHATIVVEDPGGCPVALAAERADSTVNSVSRSVADRDEGGGPDTCPTGFYNV